MISRALWGGCTLLLIGLGFGACGGDGSEAVPECLQVVSSCTDMCEITCAAGTQEACAGPDRGFDIDEDERCCFCAPVPRSGGGY